MQTRTPLRAWVWPPPAIARRIWWAILAASVYSAAVYLLARDLIAQLPGWSAEFGMVNGIVLGVLVGIRTRAAFDRWWDGQRLWTDLAVQARNLALKARHLVVTDAADRGRAASLIIGFVDALRLRLAGGDARLQRVPGFEEDPAAPVNVPAHLGGRLYNLAVGWHRAGKVDLPGLYALEANVRALLDVAGHGDRVRLPPIPASFHALLRHGLVLSLVLAPWHLIFALGLWAIPVQALIIYFLFGVELTAEEIENPFGSDTDDLPLRDYAAAIRRDVLDVLTAGPGAGPPRPAPDAPRDPDGVIGDVVSGLADENQL